LAGKKSEQNKALAPDLVNSAGEEHVRQRKIKMKILAALTVAMALVAGVCTAPDMAGLFQAGSVLKM